MTKLTDTQLVILSTACGRDDRHVFPITASLKGGALNKVLQSLLAKELIEEVPAEASNIVWRDEDEGPLTLRATHAAAVALGIEMAEAATEPEPATQPARKPVRGGKASKGIDAPAEATMAPTAETAGRDGPKVRAGTKQALLIEMLCRAEGATIEEVIAATGWQAHTVRGAMAGALKKKLGLVVTSEKDVGRGRVYRVT